MMHIKEWKIAEFQREFNGGFLEDIIEVVRETEKAALLLINWGYTSSLHRTEKVWVPKSCLLNDEEYAADRAERNAEKEARFEAGKKRYEAIYAFAAEKGLKLRKGLKAKTAIAIIEACGYAVEF